MNNVFTQANNLKGFWDWVNKETLGRTDGETLKNSIDQLINAIDAHTIAVTGFLRDHAQTPGAEGRDLREDARDRSRNNAAITVDLRRIARTEEVPANMSLLKGRLDTLYNWMINHPTEPAGEAAADAKPLAEQFQEALSKAVAAGLYQGESRERRP